LTFTPTPLPVTLTVSQLVFVLYRLVWLPAALLTTLPPPTTDACALPPRSTVRALALIVSQLPLVALTVSTSPLPVPLTVLLPPVSVVFDPASKVAVSLLPVTFTTEFCPMVNVELESVAVSGAAAVPPATATLFVPLPTITSPDPLDAKVVPLPRLSVLLLPLSTLPAPLSVIVAPVKFCNHCPSAWQVIDPP